MKLWKLIHRWIDWLESDSVEETTKDESTERSDSKAKSPGFPERVRNAVEQYEAACEAMAKTNPEPTNRQVYDLLENIYAKDGKSWQLPAFATWTRYLRQWRLAASQQKNEPRPKANTTTRRPGEVALLDVVAVAKLLACSKRTVYRLTDAGKMPRSVKIGALVRWDRETLLAWIRDGCKPAGRATVARR